MYDDTHFILILRNLYVQLKDIPFASGLRRDSNQGFLQAQSRGCLFHLSLYKNQNEYRLYTFEKFELASSI